VKFSQLWVSSCVKFFEASLHPSNVHT
jgi:hypothetical protein